MNNMSKDSKKIVPLRGSAEDWSGNKEEEKLEEKKDYAKKIMTQMTKGSPDFEEYEDSLSTPTDNKE